MNKTQQRVQESLETSLQAFDELRNEIFCWQLHCEQLKQHLLSGRNSTDVLQKLVVDSSGIRGHVQKAIESLDSFLKTIDQDI